MSGKGLMKIIVCCAAAVVIFAVPVFAANVVVDPGFENNNNFADWTVAGAGWATQGATVYAGTLSAENTIPTLAAQDHYGALSQTFVATAGTTYYASAWVKSNISPVSSAVSGIEIKFLNSSGSIIGTDVYQDFVGGNTDWRQVYIEQVAPATTAEIEISVFSFASQGDTLAEGGLSYFDEVVLDTTPITPPSVSFPLYNGNFENGLHDWVQSGPNWEVETALPYTGSYSAKNTIVSMTGTSNYYAGLAQEREIDSGQTVYATAKVKTSANALSLSYSGLSIDFFDASHTLIANSEVQDFIGGTQDWTQIYVSAAAPAQAAYARLRCFIFANQSDPFAVGTEAYFDEVVLDTAPITPPGTLNNPDFENGLNSWTITHPNVTPGTLWTWDVESANPFAGTYSAKNIININDLNSGATDYFASLHQDLGASAGVTYYATLQLKTEINPASSASVGLVIEFLNSSGQVVDTFQQTIGGDMPWTQLYVSATAPALTTQVRYRCIVYALASDLAAHGGIAYFDEAIFTDQYIAPPASQLNNPNFENALNGWTIVEAQLDPNITTDPTWGTESVNPFSGVYSAKNIINVDDLDLLATDEYFAAVKQEMATTVGTTFYATLKTKTAIDPTSLARAGLVVEFLNSGGDVIQNSQTGEYYSYKQTVGGNTDWTELYVKATAPPATSKIRYSCIVATFSADASAQGGIAYFDEAVLTTNYIAPPAVSAQLIDPGFENGVGSWNITHAYLNDEIIPAPIPTWSIESATPFAGDHSPKNTININDLDPNADEYFASVYQEVQATVGSTYYGTLQAKTEINVESNAQAGMLMEFLGSNGEVLIDPLTQEPYSYSDTIGGQANWTQLYLAVEAPANTARVRYSCIVAAGKTDLEAHGGIAYFDEAIFTNNPITPPAINLINSGFENGLSFWTTTHPNLEQGTPVTWDLEDVNHFMGIYSAKNVININDLNQTTPPLADSYYTAVSQEFYINSAGGTPFYGTLQAKSDIDATSNAQIGMTIEFLDSEGEVLVNAQTEEPYSYSDTIGGQANWTQLYLAVESPVGVNVAKVRYSCSVFAEKTDTAAHGGKAYFDETVFTTTPIAPPYGGDLVNPGFENGLNLWDVVHPDLNSSAALTWDIEAINQYGTYSAKNAINTADLNGAAESYYAAVSQEFYIDPQNQPAEYFATILAKTAIHPISMAEAGLKIDFLDEYEEICVDVDGDPIESVDTIGGTTDWRLLYAAVETPSDANKVRYTAFVFAEKDDVVANVGVAYFDQGVFSSTLIPPPTPNSNLINPDLENGLHDWRITEPGIDWEDPLSATSSWVAQTSQVNSGILAAKNTINSMNLLEGFDYYADLSQEILASSGFPLAGKPIYATIQVKTDFVPNSSAIAGLKVEAIKADGSVEISGEDEVFGPNEWNQLEVFFVAGPDTEKIVYTFYVYATANDALADGTHAYFDDASVIYKYINHLGMSNGQDVFPQETAQQTYYTGSASTRAVIRYLLGSSPTQTSLYNAYHWSGPGDDMLSGEIMTALNGEVGLPYHFTDWYQTANQADAIKNFVYWVDYVPPMGTFSPAAVPVNGGLNWRLVRGIVTDIKPHPIGVPMPNFSVEGMWVNDSTSPGLGFNYYQTTTAFEADYQPIPSTGTYRAVYEPPENLDQNAYLREMQNSNCQLVQAKPNSSLALAFSKLDDNNQLRNTVQEARIELSKEMNPEEVLSFEGGFSSAPTPVFSLIYLKKALPKPLVSNPEFISVFDKVQSMRKIDVTCLDDNQKYVILALDKPFSTLEALGENQTKTIASPKGSNYYSPLQNGVAKTHILVEANPNNGACLQATWYKPGEIYPRISKQDAISLAVIYAAKGSATSKYNNNKTSLALNAQADASLVWSKDFGTSRFHPSYKVQFGKSMVYYVHPDGKVITKINNSGF